MSRREVVLDRHLQLRFVLLLPRMYIRSFLCFRLRRIGQGKEPVMFDLGGLGRTFRRDLDWR